MSFYDESLEKHMCVGADGKVPTFYKFNIKEVESVTQRNARLEFEAIWREHERLVQLARPYPTNSDGYL